MVIEVVFFRQGSVQPLSSSLSSSGRFEFVWRERKEHGVNTNQWRRSAVELTRLRSDGSIDLFLCLKARHLTELVSWRFASEVVKAAQNHIREASIYIVAPASLEPLGNLIELREHRESLCEWFEKMRELHVTDIIQATINTSESVSVWREERSLSKLYNGAARSRERRAALYPDGNWGGWGR